MAVFNLPALVARLSPGARLLGIDPGARTIGLALSDVGLRLAGPYRSLKRGKLRANADAIAAIAANEGVGGLVIGWPLDDDGRMGPAAQAARDWAHALSAATGLPATLWDETLTTAEATEQMIAADVSRARRRAVVDQMAAARILQAALDAMRE